MKILYIANTRIPTEKSYGMAMMKLCESFADAGAEVEFVIPTRRNPAFCGVDVFRHYGVKRNFRIVELPCMDLMDPPIPSRLSFPLGFVQYFLFVRALLRYLRGKEKAIIFSREPRILYLLRKLPNFKAYEIHLYPENMRFFYRKLLRAVDKIIVTNSWKKAKLVAEYAVAEEKIGVVPNAADVEAFLHTPISQSEARERVGLPKHKKLVLYVGGFQHWKGVYVLAKSVPFLPKDIELHLVGGGPEPERSRFLQYLAKKSNGAVFIHEAVPHTEVPFYLAAADLLVAPGSRLYKEGAFYSSPLKVFEYVASGRPFILTDLSSFREALTAALGREDLSDISHLLVQPNDPKALAAAIVHALAHVQEWTPLVDTEDMRQRLSWTRRGERIIALFPKET